MAVFDITSCIMSTENDVNTLWYRGGLAARQRKLIAIKEWLTETVGEYYGDSGRESPTTHIGSGWELYILYNHKREQPPPVQDHDVEITWEVDITDEQMAMLFALTWLK